jgi:hypothetical protein
LKQISVRVIILVALGLGTFLLQNGVPTIAAQPTDNYIWKTYINPKLGFQIDYPEMKFMNFIEHETLPSILIVGDFAFTLDMITLNDTVKDTKQYAQTVINDSISLHDWKMLHNIEPVSFANMSGYSASTYTKAPNNITFVNKYIFLTKDDKIIQFTMNDDSQDYHEKTFDKMVNSTKFFDQS